MRMRGLLRAFVSVWLELGPFIFERVQSHSAACDIYLIFRVWWEAGSQHMWHILHSHREKATITTAQRVTYPRIYTGSMSTPPILLLKPENCHFLNRDVVSVDVVPLKKGCFRRGVERKNLKHDRFALVVDVLDPFCCHQPLIDRNRKRYVFYLISLFWN